MRPVGDIRRALREAMEGAGELQARQIASRACVGLLATRQTLCNMVRAGEAEIVDTARAARGRPAALYRLLPALNAGAGLTPLQQHRALTADA